MKHEHKTMGIRTKYYEQAVKEAERRRRLSGKDWSWQDIIRHAIEIGILQALQYTGSGQWTKNEDIVIRADTLDIRATDRRCPATRQPTDCHKACYDKKTGKYCSKHPMYQKNLSKS